MTKSEKKICIVVCAVLIFLAAIATFITLDPIGRGLWNIRMFAVQKADDSTSYTTRKEVEDTCRAMVSSYEADKLTYLQYNGNDNEEKQSWAEQAKMRANKTASTYNNYILENSFVWSGNVPIDIQSELPYLEQVNKNLNNMTLPQARGRKEPSVVSYLRFSDNWPRFFILLKPATADFIYHILG